MKMRQSRPAAFDHRVTRSGPGDGRGRATRQPDSRASYEQYLSLAKAKALAGDQIEAERYYQCADHYHRLMNGTAA